MLPPSPLSSEEKNLVRSSWRYFVQIDPSILGEVFFAKLYADHPNIKRNYYSIGIKQYQALHHTINLAILRMDRLDFLDQSWETIGEKWHLPPFPHPQYGWIEDALIWTITQGIGQGWNIQTEKAWRRYYDILIYRLFNPTASLQ